MRQLPRSESLEPSDRDGQSQREGKITFKIIIPPRAAVLDMGAKSEFEGLRFRSRVQRAGSQAPLIRQLAQTFKIEQLKLGDRFQSSAFRRGAQVRFN